MGIGKYDLKLSKYPYYLKRIGRRLQNSNIDTKAVFIVGNQRSGTTMLVSKLNRHFWIDVFHESSIAMRDWHLKPFSELGLIIKSSKAKICIFKPLEDSHRVNELLEYFKDSRALFIFRHYSDVVNSSIKLGWGTHLKQYINNIHDNIEFKYSGPLNLTPQNIQTINDLYYENKSAENCAALVWYLRNTIYFDHNLHVNPKVLLIQFERIVSNPQKEFKDVIHFIGLRPSRSVLYDVRNLTLRKTNPPVIDEPILKICDGCMRD